MIHYAYIVHRAFKYISRRQCERPLRSIALCSLKYYIYIFIFILFFNFPNLSNSCKNQWLRARCIVTATRRSNWPICSIASRKPRNVVTGRQKAWSPIARTRCWTRAARARAVTCCSPYPRTGNSICKMTFPTLYRRRWFKCRRKRSPWPTAVVRPTANGRLRARRSRTHFYAPVARVCGSCTADPRTLCSNKIRSASYRKYTCTCRLTFENRSPRQS